MCSAPFPRLPRAPPRTPPRPPVSGARARGQERRGSPAHAPRLTHYILLFRLSQFPARIRTAGSLAEGRPVDQSDGKKRELMPEPDGWVDVDSSAGCAACVRLKTAPGSGWEQRFGNLGVAGRR